MRKLIITAAFAALALTGVAACADNSEPGTSTTTTPAGGSSPSAAGDQTKQVCDEAQSASTTAADALKAKATELAAAGSDQAKQLQIGTELATIAGDWSKKLNELSAKPIKPEVKQALTEGVSTINSLSNPMTLQSTSAAQVETQLKALAAKLTAACAAS